MNLTYNQFEVLVYIEQRQDKKHTQRILADALDMSLGNVNKTLEELKIQELIVVEEGSRYQVTLKGYHWLEPHKVKKAIFIAAGFGSRLVPITLNTPKPLILVHGKRIIDSLLDAVIAAGIEDITIVRGYLGEQFDVLLKKYPMIKFIENPAYNESNNISSMMRVRHDLANSYVFESDLLLYNPNVIRKYEYASNYLGMKVDMTDDWCFHTKKGYIAKLSVGGKDCHHMFGISYWTKDDGDRLAEDIKTSFEMPGGKEKYWDEVSLRDFISKYKVMVKPCYQEDIIEIDTFNELKAIDSIYAV